MTRAERNHAADLAVRRMTRRLVALHASTTAADLAAGLAWYDRARAAAESMAIGDDVDRAAAVIAHLSPRQQWAANVAGAARMLQAAADGDDCPPVGITDDRRKLDQRTKAWRVATGEASPFTDHGPKTEAFLANILGDASRVCVDSWAARAATGDPSHRGPGSRAEYARMERAYVRAARAVGMAPRDLQAAIWIHIRGAAD